MKAFLEAEARCFEVRPEDLSQLGEQATRPTGKESVLMTTLFEMIHNWRGGGGGIKGQARSLQDPVQLSGCPETVLQWDQQMALLSKLDSSQREFLQQCPLVPFPASSVPSWKMFCADAHCHLQRMFRHLAVRKSKDAWMAARSQGGSSVIDEVDVVIDNHVFRDDWGVYTSLPNVMVVHTVGAHPRLASGSPNMERLKQLAKHDLCVAIGECGLDVTAADMKKQEALFRQHITWAVEADKPLVLHLRGKEGDSTTEHERALQILKEIAPQGHPLHIHCYTGGWEMARKWQQYTRNIIFGFTWLSTTALDFKMLAARLPIECLAIESDAPYLPPSGEKPNTPFTIWKIADKLREHRPLPTPLLLHIARRNTKRFYRI